MIISEVKIKSIVKLKDEKPPKNKAKIKVMESVRENICDPQSQTLKNRTPGSTDQRTETCRG